MATLNRSTRSGTSLGLSATKENIITYGHTQFVLFIHCVLKNNEVTMIQIVFQIVVASSAIAKSSTPDRKYIIEHTSALICDCRKMVKIQHIKMKEIFVNYILSLISKMQHYQVILETSHQILISQKACIIFINRKRLQ